jgi:hypothetical protein
MTSFSSLKLSSTRKPVSMPLIVRSRNKLLFRLAEQIQLAQAALNGSQFSTKRMRTIRDADGGSRVVEVARRVRQWWFTGENGKTLLNIRYGSKVIELAKGKFSIEISSPSELIEALMIVKTAVERGELDSQLEQSTNSLRGGFKR